VVACSYLPIGSLCSVDSDCESWACNCGDATCDPTLRRCGPTSCVCTYLVWNGVWGCGSGVTGAVYAGYNTPECNPPFSCDGMGGCR
jgi:hypothetical protein